MQTQSLDKLTNELYEGDVGISVNTNIEVPRVKTKEGFFRKYTRGFSRSLKSLAYTALIPLVLAVGAREAKATMVNSNYSVELYSLLKADINNDYFVNFQDYAILANDWMKTGLGLEGDINGDNIVDYNDLEMLAENWLCEKPKSKIAFASNRDGNYEIYIMNADGSNQTRLTYNDAVDREPAWSPDGKKIAFSSNRDGNYEIYIMNADGTNLIRLTYTDRDERAPAWRYNEDKILYHDPYLNGTIYIMNVDGSSQTALTTGWDPSWSLGKKIVFCSNIHVGHLEIYTMNPNGSDQTRLTFDNMINLEPVWSPDDAKIAAVRRIPTVVPEGPFISGVYIMDTDGSNQEWLSYNEDIFDINPTWSPDASKIAFSSNRDGNYEIYIMNADGSNVIRLTNNTYLDNDPAWSPYLTK